MAKRYRGPYRLTASRKRALRKAQLVSARKRKGKSLSRNQKIAATGVTAAVIAGSAAYARHKASGSVLMINVGGRTPTPVQNLNGVVIPSTKSGLTVGAHGPGDFSYTYTHRNKSGDRTLFSYRHRPLTMESLRSTFGSRIKGGPEQAAQWSPSSAEFTDRQEDLFRWANQDPMTRVMKRRRRDLKIKNSPNNKLMAVVNDPITLRQSQVPRKINNLESHRRLKKYINGLKSQGVPYNFDHIIAAGRRFREQDY